MDSEKVKEIKKALEQNDDNGIMYEVNDKKRICKFIHHKDVLTIINELESENKELRVVTDIANERAYRKKFTDEWRKEYQKELDKEGKGYIAGHPDFDLVYKLYFEQKDRIAELEKENDELKVDIKNSIDMQKQMLDGFKNTTKEVEENLAREIPNLLKRFAERLIDKKIKLGDRFNIYDINETLKEFIK